MRTVFKVLLGLLVLIVLISIIANGFSSGDSGTTASEAQPTAVSPAEPTAVPETKPTPSPATKDEPTVEVVQTPTVEEALTGFILCQRLIAGTQMLWGQTPDTIYSNDPRTSGNIKPGDYVKFLMSEPRADGTIRILVYPYDNRTVGNSDNQVWIDWGSLVQFRLDQVMFECED